jgi:hypothetical protein
MLHRPAFNCWPTRRLNTCFWDALAPLRRLQMKINGDAGMFDFTMTPVDDG